ncbi:hypothetical protein WJX75_000491 [Coccomyxa subellipsoidea]|uniref:Uncharacterized protein n=1 Tax=Coccomyxa subellipsoidea TaxID=248742 RepID=A0ABR2YSJ1_9CHLO
MSSMPIACLQPDASTNAGWSASFDFLRSQGPGKSVFNSTRPFLHAFPRGWQLLFLPSVVSGSPHRWLAYDDKGRFSDYDVASDEETDYYDYSSEDLPGCSIGITPNFLQNSILARVPAKNVTVNKSAYWPDAYYNSKKGIVDSSGGMTLLPYICTPIAGRVAHSQGTLITLLPTAAVVVGAIIILLAVLSALFCIVWFVVGCCTRKAV